jgi:glutamyl-Q tRNA(Asp) synthetase
MSIVSRFAPSPTGLLHLGHVFAAGFARSRARAGSGRFLLRLEDIDPTRCRPEFADAILEDLRWLGLSWDGPVRVQSEHFAEYRGVLAVLDARGLLYPCFCTRADIAREAAASASAPHGPDGPLYPGTCRRLPPAAGPARLRAGEPHAMRPDLARALAEIQGPLMYQEDGVGEVVCRPERFGDPILARKDSPASYHLCVTHDDALQGITLVTRGEDLRPSTDLQRLLQVLMGWLEPRYAHHRLLTDESGRRFAKRNQSVTVRALREAGCAPAEVLARAGLTPAGDVA